MSFLRRRLHLPLSPLPVALAACLLTTMSVPLPPEAPQATSPNSQNPQGHAPSRNVTLGCPAFFEGSRSVLAMFEERDKDFLPCREVISATTLAVDSALSSPCFLAPAHSRWAKRVMDIVSATLMGLAKGGSDLGRPHQLIPSGHLPPTPPPLRTRWRPPERPQGQTTTHAWQTTLEIPVALTVGPCQSQQPISRRQPSHLV
ncbi:hypothetical protein GGS21DRAFT_413926 [Xylaria nigripes]|nr:hypothetical protein GGS21DRAFT_413926 [Xylaria nigripes]